MDGACEGGNGDQGGDSIEEEGLVSVGSCESGSVAEVMGLELLVNVDEVGTVVLRVDGFRVVVEESVVDVIMRSMCEAKLSEEGFREWSLRGCFDLDLSRLLSGSVCWGGGYWCFWAL